MLALFAQQQAKQESFVEKQYKQLRTAFIQDIRQAALEGSLATEKQALMQAFMTKALAMANVNPLDRFSKEMHRRITADTIKIIKNPNVVVPARAAQNVRIDNHEFELLEAHESPKRVQNFRVMRKI